ncbi:MAG: hypothetical protein VXZ05_04260 [Pseudomonadota bacterium]|nr:hypothetical protein [Pseudomonadota bacterium]
MKTPLGLEAELPVMELFKDALFLLWEKRAFLIPMFAPIIVVMVMLEFYSTHLTELLMAQMPELEHGAVPKGTWEFLIVSGISMFLSVLMATTVHRFSLQPKALWPRNALRLPLPSDWRYLLRTVQIVVICSGAGIIVTTLLGGLATALGAPANSPIGFIAAAAVVLYLMARLSVTLPEIAIGTKGSDLGRAWRMSTGNAGRLLFVVLGLPMLVALPFTFFYLFGHLVTNLIAAFGVYVMTLVSVTVLSLSYQFLREFYEPEVTELVEDEKADDDNSSLDA